MSAYDPKRTWVGAFPCRFEPLRYPVLDLGGANRAARVRGTFLGGAVTAWPLIARAQRLVTPVIGFLHAGAFAEAPQLLTAFRQGLKELGFVESQNIAIEYRFAGNQNDQLPALAADLVQRQVTVIVAVTTPAALAAKAATTTVPIVFQAGADPVQIGLVASLNRPGGNVTGVSNLSIGLATKRIELMRQVMPDAKLIAVLVRTPRNSAITLFELELCVPRFKHNLVSGYISSKQAQSAISTPPSPKSSNSELARSPSAPTRSSLAGRMKLPRWRHVMACQQFIHFAHLPRPAD